MAGLNVTDVGVCPTPSLKFSMSCSLFERGPSLSCSDWAVAPAGKSLPSPVKPYGLSRAGLSLSCSGSLGSKLTSPTTPSGNSVGSILIGNLPPANNTSAI